jgi:hypothetical protein
MKRKEFLELIRAAETEKGNLDESDALHGLALHKDRRMVTKAGAIGFIRYQAQYMFGDGWDTEELENLAHCFKRVDLIEE